MDNQVLGIHHITAIAGPAQRNYDFYSKVLGLRFVKKTVNFDDPGTYHFYFGNETGTPGTILTFFPWSLAQHGRLGTGIATEIGYSVPRGSLDFWRKRFEVKNVKFNPDSELFGERFISFEDVDGLKLKLIVPQKEDSRKPWTTDEVKEESATKGFHGITLTVRKADPTAKILTDIFGYEFQQQENNVHRYRTPSIETASVVDLVEEPELRPGLVSVGINHHVAFRVKNEDTLMEVREKVLSVGLHATPKIDRNYFFSVYFREPGGVLFELATDNPGFAVDEEVVELGTHLKLPAQYESNRSLIQKTLDPLNT